MSEALKGLAPEMVNYTDEEGFQAAGGWFPNEGIAEYVPADRLAAVEAERDALREAVSENAVAAVINALSVLKDCKRSAAALHMRSRYHEISTAISGLAAWLAKHGGQDG